MFLFTIFNSKYRINKNDRRHKAGVFKTELK